MNLYAGRGQISNNAGPGTGRKQEGQAMKFNKTVISTQPLQHPPVAQPDTSGGPRRLLRRLRGRPVPLPEAAPPEQPFLTRSDPLKDDPFSCLPSIYDPEADFVVDSAYGDIREFLTPEPDAPGAATD